MGNLEERFFAKEHETSIEFGDEKADLVADVIVPAVCKGEEGYSFCFDKIYDVYRNAV